jgi:chemotaxis protein CheX
MKAEYINPFVKAAYSVLEMVLGETPVKDELTTQPTIFTSQQCNVVFGVTGQIKGSVILGMSLQTADLVASQMLGQPIKVFDQLAASAVAELGNMICGNALVHLCEAGFECDITPPTVIRGEAEISTLTVPAIVVGLAMPQGRITLIIGLQGRK